MKRTQARISPPLVWAIAVGLLVGLASSARADGHHKPIAHKPCSDATLDGSFGYYRTGKILPDGGPLVAVGIFTYDGNGNTVGTESVNRNGDIGFDEGGTGRYQVNPDCTGMLLNDDGEEYARLVVVNDGNDIYIFSENNPVYVVATRIHKN
jgi:hypothetical protein